MNDILQAPGHPISYFPKLAPVTGSIKATILLQQITYLTKRGHGSDGWITKERGRDEWMDDTGLTLKELQLAIEALVKRDLIQREYHRRNHQLRLRLNVDVYNKAIQEITSDESTPKHMPKEHMPKRHMPKGNMPHISPDISMTSEIEEDAESEHVTKGHMPKGNMACAKREHEHVTKGHIVCSKYLDSRNTEKETTKETNKKTIKTGGAETTPRLVDDLPPMSPDSPAVKFVSWWNEQIVPLGGRPFSLDDADAKFITKANKALKPKGSKGFWERVRLGFEGSLWLQGKITPHDGRRRFKASLPWLLSLHHTKGMANYCLVAEGEWTDDQEPINQPRRSISHDEVEL